LQNPVSVCAIHFAVRSKVASGTILAQPINSVEVAKLALCNWLCGYTTSHCCRAKKGTPIFQKHVFMQSFIAVQLRKAELLYHLKI
jgi:hypothetical protein